MEENDYVQHPCLPADASTSSDVPPIKEVDFMGKLRPCKWKTVLDAGGRGTDNDGWQYAVDFYTQGASWTPEPANFSHVRRRLWHPEFEEQADPVAPPLNRLKSTLMVEKGLAQTSGQAKQLFSIDVGILPLSVLAEQLEADNWMEPDSLMVEYFDTMSKAKDVDIGPWAKSNKVDGLVRPVQMRVPVPPAPMCPEETRVSSTWHVASSTSKVVLESVLMSLDVPYGDCFNIVVVDTFHVDTRTGRTHMMRVLAIEWVKSTWLKNMIETNVNSEIKAAGERWAKLIAEWALRAQRAREVSGMVWK